MNTRQTILPLLAFTLAAMVACNGCKDEETCMAGSGGNLTLVVKLEHHTINIPNDSLRPDTVWVKYNASDWANAPQGYDLQVVGDFPEDHVHVEGLKCGQYYLYASGWDTSISQVVKGGIPYNTDQSTGEVIVKIPVVE